MPITIDIDNMTGLYPANKTWIAGSVGSSFLQSNGTFSSAASGLTFFEMTSGAKAFTISFTSSEAGGGRLMFVVSPTQPALPAGVGGFTAYPYAAAPGDASPGPFDIFEFSWNGAFDVSAVNGFGLNLSFSVAYQGKTYRYGANNPAFCRADFGTAFKKFIDREARSSPSASAYRHLLYDGPMQYSALPNPPAPPAVPSGNPQFFAICDPNDQLLSATQNGTAAATDDPLASYWDATLNSFFAPGNFLSIDLGGNIYSGTCTGSGYALSNGSHTYSFANPVSAAKNYAGALYVFGQAFGPGGPAAPDQGLLQDTIWEALCRGVAQDGVSTKAITHGESTTAWNNPATWYQEGKTCHLFAKFLHYSNIEGNDCRIDPTKGQLFIDSAAYGYSMDENPMGGYTGPQVPSKTPFNVPDGSTVTIVVGRWFGDPA